MDDGGRVAAEIGVEEKIELEDKLLRVKMKMTSGNALGMSARGDESTEYNADFTRKKARPNTPREHLAISLFSDRLAFTFLLSQTSCSTRW